MLHSKLSGVDYSTYIESKSYYDADTGLFDLDSMDQHELEESYEYRYSSGQLTDDEMDAA